MLTRRVTVAAIVVAAVAGGGIAYAAGQSSSPATSRQAYLDDVAKRLNVTPQQLQDALTGARDDQLDQAVKDGKLTQQQADAIKQKAKSAPGGGPLFFGGPGGPGGNPGFGGGPGMRARGFGFGFDALKTEADAAAKYLGLTSADLRKQLAAGKSPADLANAQNKDLAGLKQTLTDTAKSQLADAVKAGKLTQDQADKISSQLAAHIDDIVNGALPHFGKRFGPRLRMHP
jgi:polyhydroxyalkanoate synthesis regulator phasin